MADCFWVDMEHSIAWQIIIAFESWVRPSICVIRLEDGHCIVVRHFIEKKSFVVALYYFQTSRLFNSPLM
jgi:hypothetical protein